MEERLMLWPRSIENNVFQIKKGGSQKMFYRKYTWAFSVEASGGWDRYGVKAPILGPLRKENIINGSKDVCLTVTSHAPRK